jgi:hypothetical protein
MRGFGCGRKPRRELNDSVPKALPAEIVECDVLFFNPQVVKHLKDRGVHHWWATDVVLNVFRSGMIFQIVVVENLMDEPGVAVPVIFWQGLDSAS